MAYENEPAQADVEVLHRGNKKKKMQVKPGDALGAYLEQISQTPLLTREEELALAFRMQEGDEEARDHFIRANLALVVNIAKKTGVHSAVSLMDRIQAGNLGLIRAVEGFKPELNNRFSTYAKYWIQQSIQRCIHNTAREIFIPRYLQEICNVWNQTAMRLLSQSGRTPTDTEIQTALGITTNEYQSAMLAFKVLPPPSRITPYDSDGGFGCVEAIDPPARDELVESDRRSALEMLPVVAPLLDRLDEKERYVIDHRFALGNKPKMTLKNIGEHLGLTRERVRQIEAETILKLQEWMHVHICDENL